jgi:hypothetical protein
MVSNSQMHTMTDKKEHGKILKTLHKGNINAIIIFLNILINVKKAQRTAHKGGSQEVSHVQSLISRLAG